MGKSTAVPYRSFAESELFVCRFHFVTSFSSLVRAQQSKLKTYQFEVAKINERSTVRPTDRYRLIESSLLPMSATSSTQLNHHSFVLFEYIICTYELAYVWLLLL